MAKKKEPKMPATSDEPATKAVRLDLDLADWRRLDFHARRRGLNKAAAARMVILEWLDVQDLQKGSTRGQ